MAVVGLYSVPQSTRDPFSIYTRNVIVPWIRHYTRLTSQWQQWNLFSPDPLLRVTRFRVERFSSFGWQSIAQLEIPRRSFFKHVDSFKVLDRITGAEPHLAAMRERYLLSQCAALRIPPGIRLRLASDYVDVPRIRMTIEQWRRWQPIPTPNDQITTVTCPKR